ncbi:MAG: TldD/PmbA family protein [Planctomycetes bacterium]|nr:TldD/PmbA family protein [Planctomycetota bacterium]
MSTSEGPLGTKSEGLLSRLAPLSTEGARGEVFEASFDTLEVGFSAGAVKSALARESSGIGLRAVAEGRMGFVGSRDLSAEGLAHLEKQLVNSLEVGDPAEMTFPSTQAPDPAAADLGLSSPITAALTIPDLVETGEAALAQLKERFPDVTFDATVRRSVGRSRLQNTSGLDTGEAYTVFSFSVEANQTQDEDVLLDYAYVVGTSPEAAAPQRVVDELVQRLTWSQTVVEWTPGKLPVLFSPEGSSLIWSPLLQALSGKTVMLGTSPLRERSGEQILGAQITLTDDGLRPGALGSGAYDEEGIPRATRSLIKAGVLKGFVHSLETALATGSEPTGNGERGGATARPEPGFANLILSGGDQSFEELLASIDYGILVHSVIGEGQGNTLPGTFSNPLDLAFLIEGGVVKGRIKDGSIAGDIYQLLGPDTTARLSREVVPVGGSSFLPWLLIDDLNVVGRE